MRRLRAWMLRLQGLWPNSKRERELADELEGHLQLHIDDNLRSGMPPDQARREAIVKLGGIEATKEACRDRSSLPFLENVLQDLRFAIRQLGKNPGFTFTAILMLAVGMCASVAIFAFVDAALIKPLPYRDPKRLVAVFEATKECPQCNVSYFNFRDWKHAVPFFSSLDAWGFSTYLLRTSMGTEPAMGARVSDGFFRTLGISPILGRDFYSGEDTPGVPHTVLISYSAWQNRFAGSPNVVGHVATLSNVAYTIIGVLPREFQFAPRGPAEFWTPLNDLTGCDQRRGCHGLFAIARLRDGVALSASLAGMRALAEQMEKLHPENRGFGADVVPLSEIVTGNIRPVLLVLLSGAAMLLVIGCVNVSSLLLVRSESRRREIAVRSALGASQARIVRQFLTEGLLLAGLGSALGLAAADWTMHLLTALIPGDKMKAMPFLHDLGLNASVVAFAGLIALLAALLFSFTPALHFSFSKTREGLAEGSRGSAGKAWRRLGSKLVVLELATALVLLVGAALLGQSLYRLLRVDIGIQPEHLATLQVTMPNSYVQSVQVAVLERKLISRLENIPGVKSVGISTTLPLKSWGMAANVLVAGRPWNGEHNAVPQRNVSADYLQTLGARLLRGRYFTEAEDDPERPPTAIINEIFARQYFPGQNPLGRRLLYEGAHDSMEIVGVVADIKEGQLDTASRPTIYVPFTQGWFRSFNLVVRTLQDEQSIFSSLTEGIRQIDPDIATESAISMTAAVNDSQSAYLHRSSAWLVGGFASLALVLSVVGLYGVIAYSVSQRTREVGIRVALGADRSSVARLILKEAAWLTTGGIVIGLGCSIAAAAAIRGLLFGVEAWDVPTLAAVATVLGVAALLASYIPARRAASLNPVETLRAE
jgi:macrolide transport system ATP-binding/permease protein